MLLGVSIDSIVLTHAISLCSVQEMLTIATCEFREEDEEAQVLFWENINVVMIEHQGRPANFFGFMVDEAGAN